MDKELLFRDEQKSGFLSEMESTHNEYAVNIFENDKKSRLLH